MAAVQSDPILAVDHLTMRFGGLTAVGDLVLLRRAATTSPR